MGVRVGFRAGPVSVGTSWRAKDTEAAVQLVGWLLVLGLVAIPIMLAILAISWPYLLGEHLATGWGVGHGGQRVIAWSFEGVYLAVLLIIGLTVLYKLAMRDQARKKHQDAMAHVNDLASTSESLLDQAAEAEAAATVLDNWIEIMRAVPEGLEESQVADMKELRAAGFELAPGERLLGALKVGFSMPRVAVRNGPKVQTTVVLGRCVVTNRQLWFLSTERSETWRVPAITGVVCEGARVLLPVSTRRTVYGLDTSVDDSTGSATHLLVALVGWARGLPAAPIQQVADLEKVRDDSRAKAAMVEEEMLLVEDNLHAAKSALASLSLAP